jgi:general stress protein 26
VEKAELKKKILETVRAYPIASVATLKDGKPWVRYMVTNIEEDLSFWTTSFAKARKIDQIKKCADVHLTFGADPKDWRKPYVNAAGKAEILTDLDSKKKCWHEILAEFFSGPEDPGYVVLKITPETIEYMHGDAMEPEVYRMAQG